MQQLTLPDERRRRDRPDATSAIWCLQLWPAASAAAHLAADQLDRYRGADRYQYDRSEQDAQPVMVCSLLKHGGPPDMEQLPSFFGFTLKQAR
jgi:hypothetical protein